MGNAGEMRSAIQCGTTAPILGVSSPEVARLLEAMKQVLGAEVADVRVSAVGIYACFSGRPARKNGKILSGIGNNERRSYVLCSEVPMTRGRCQ